MTAEGVRRICLGLPAATENLQWGEHLVFKVGGKMFAVANLDGQGNTLSFKCSPEEFAELVEMEGIIAAPYLARAHWVRWKPGTQCQRRRWPPACAEPTN